MFNLKEVDYLYCEIALYELMDGDPEATHLITDLATRAELILEAEKQSGEFGSEAMLQTMNVEEWILQIFDENQASGPAVDRLRTAMWMYPQTYVVDNLSKKFDAHRNVLAYGGGY